MSLCNYAITSCVCELFMKILQNLAVKLNLNSNNQQLFFIKKFLRESVLINKFRRESIHRKFLSFSAENIKL